MFGGPTRIFSLGPAVALDGPGAKCCTSSTIEIMLFLFVCKCTRFFL